MTRFLALVLDAAIVLFPIAIAWWFYPWIAVWVLRWLPL